MKVGGHVKAQCQKLNVQIVSLADVADPAFVYDVRDFCWRLGISRDAWLDRLADWLRDFNGQFVDEAGQPFEINLDAFDGPNVRYYFRDNGCTRPNPNGYVHPIATERFRVVATILKARFPAVASTWGKREREVQTFPPCAA
jgi:hypothetical protein